MPARESSCSSDLQGLVNNATGLKSAYDFVLIWVPEDAPKSDDPAPTLEEACRINSV